jgi:hypothetical protein
VDAIGPVRASSVADLPSGIAVAPLPVLLALDVLETWHVVLLTVFGTLADAAGSAARQSLVPVAADAGGLHREQANARCTASIPVAAPAGALVTGLLIDGLGLARASLPLSPRGSSPEPGLWPARGPGTSTSSKEGRRAEGRQEPSSTSARESGVVQLLGLFACVGRRRRALPDLPGGVVDGPVRPIPRPASERNTATWP